ncbi:helix-turn-helix domain-containing protein [Streptosporangium sp. CA-115845]|uniref:helix-turn-helix domain-containing protein n=1 Tax=Streptosporangium sp. CA-115845 TaxID=3240071 RepID=UPI003D908FDC
MQTRPPRKRPIDQDPAAIRHRRLSAAMEQKQLASAANISTTHMSNIERGKSSAGPDVLFRIATALDCQVKDLLAT